MWWSVAIICIILYLLFGIIAYGTVYGYLQNSVSARTAQMTRKADRLIAAYFLRFGIFGLIAALICCEGGKYGMRYKDEN